MNNPAKIRGGVSALGDYYQAGKKLTTQRHKNIGKPQIFKQGEIIKGRVLEILSHGLAVLQLPSGTMNAEISQKLKQGDELYFIVHKVVPSLTLHIYSVIFDTNRSVYEIIRILDLQSTKNIEKLLFAFRDINNEIFRTEALLIGKMYNNIPEEFIENNNVFNIAQTLAWMIKNNIKEKDFTETYFALSNLLNIERKLKIIFSTQKEKKFLKILQKYSFGKLSFFSNLVTLFDEQISGTMICDLYKYKASIPIIENLNNILTDTHHWNSSIGTHNNRFATYIPLIIDSEIKVAKIIFSFITTESYAIKRNNILLLKNTSLSKTYPPNNFRSLNLFNLKEIASTFQLKLLEESVFLSTFCIIDSESMEKNILNDDNTLNKKRISIVV